MSPAQTIHGVLVVISDIGVLITGDAGTGKSDCALELISRGHRLVADDIVEIERCGEVVTGRAADRFAGLLNIRGLGIIDVRRVFGDATYESCHDVDMVVEFRRPDKSAELKGFGEGILPSEILELRLPRFDLPVATQRNLPLLVEAAVKVLTSGGFETEREVVSNHDALVSPGGT